MSSRIAHSLPSIGPEEWEACQNVLQTAYIASGPATRAFESALAERFHRKHAVAVSSGMSALHLALHALGEGKRRTVHTSSYVCTALLNAIGLAGHQAELLDTHRDRVLMDTTGGKFSAATPTDSLIIAPQMFGLIQDLSHLPQDVLIEDCAMSLGDKALQQGIVSITSFYATKMMTTAQGGALLTDDDNLADLLRDLISYDNREDYKLRFNYAPNDLGSSMGLAQLKKLDHFIERRHRLAQHYDEQFQLYCPALLAHPKGLATQSDALFRYWVKVKNLDATIQHLQSHNIEAKAPVYKPLHRYLKLDQQRFPSSERHQRQTLSLPFYPQLKSSEQDQVIRRLLEIAEPTES